SSASRTRTSATISRSVTATASRGGLGGIYLGVLGLARERSYASAAPAPLPAEPRGSRREPGSLAASPMPQTGAGPRAATHEAPPTRQAGSRGRRATPRAQRSPRRSSRTLGPPTTRPRSAPRRPPPRAATAEQEPSPARPGQRSSDV